MGFFYMKIIERPFSTSAQFLGVYSSILGFMHGTFQVLQGPTHPTGVVIQAIGSPCQPELVWHACFPAITIIPNLLISGAIAMGLSITMLVGSLILANHKNMGWFLILLSFTLLLVGGGFVPVYIGVLTGAAVSLVKQGEHKDKKIWRLVGKFWPWAPLMLSLWLPGSWLLGHFFSQSMLALSFILFVFFDLGLPFLTLLAAYGYRNIPRVIV